ncbi:hypothetical protein CR513_19138, partial [Mucuna pruriens]
MNGAKASRLKNLMLGDYVTVYNLLSILYNLGATHSFISYNSINKLSFPTCLLSFNLLVSTLITTHVVTSNYARKILIFLNSKDTRFTSTNKAKVALEEGTYGYMILSFLEVKDSVEVVMNFPKVFLEEVSNLLDTDRGGQDKLAKDMGQILRESLHGPLTRGRLKKLEAEAKCLWKRTPQVHIASVNAKADALSESREKVTSSKVDRGTGKDSYKSPKGSSKHSQKSQHDEKVVLNVYQITKANYSIVNPRSFFSRTQCVLNVFRYGVNRSKI